jgi:hypothetical protein
VLDAGLVGALALYGLPVTHAAAAVLVYHAIAFWLPTLGGTVAYARLRPRLGERVPGAATATLQRRATSSSAPTAERRAFTPRSRRGLTDSRRIS